MCSSDLPIVSCIFTAFKTEEEYASTNVITLPKNFLNFDNFIIAWNKANMGKAFLNSFIILICVLVGSSSAAPAGRGPAEGTLAVHRPLETRQTHSPSPVRVRGAQGCTSCTCPGAATAFQSNSNI